MSTSLAGWTWDLSERTLVLTAHPDDETIGSGVLLSRLKNPRVLHLTDGAPRNPRFVSRRFQGRLAEYARVRRQEVEAAMNLAGIGRERLRWMGYSDQETAPALARIAGELANLFREDAPCLVVTHAYEGGHPDHDSLAFAVHAAVMLLRRTGIEAPEVVEMALYHAEPRGSNPQPVIQQFLPPPAGSHPAAVSIELTAEERKLKERMFSCFKSQADTLRWFLPLRPERFRQAPAYDFTLPPHDGMLFYERSGFSLTGEHWRGLVRDAMARLKIPAPSSYCPPA